MVIALRGNHPPVPTCLVQKIAGRPLAPIHLANAAAQLPYGSGEMQGEGSPLHFSIVATCEGFLRSAAHECVLRRVSIPNFHSVSDRCWSPISYFIRSTRVSLLNWIQSIVPTFLYKLSIAADIMNCKHNYCRGCPPPKWL